MTKRFVTYDLAVQLYRCVQSIQVTGSLRDQLIRAAESVALNVAEGSGRATKRDQARFYVIAFGSIREVKAAFDLMDYQDAAVRDLADHVAACIYRLLHPRP